MKEQPHTQNLLHSLIDIDTKADFLKLIEDEFDEVSKYFKDKGHQVDKKKGFIGKQVLNDNDLFIYQYYRDLHYIFWGLQGNWKTFDPVDKIYYENLKRVIEGLYQNKK